MFLGNICCFDLIQKTALREFTSVEPRHTLSSIPCRSNFDKNKRTIREQFLRLQGQLYLTAFNDSLKIIG